MANGFIGDGNRTSTANMELVVKPAGWSYGAIECYKVSFLNKEICTIKVNGSTIPLDAGQGFESDRDDVTIQSFIIVESGINFNFVAGY
jgi:hypothetical protein